MSMIKCRNTKPELVLRKMLLKLGYKGFRRNYKLFGKPDLVFVKRRVVLFVDGCFWHKCPKCFKTPETNKSFWKTKIDANVKRDKVVNKQLKELGWEVIRIWEHEIENKKLTSRIFMKLKTIGNVKRGER